MVYIKGLDKAKVLKALWDGSHAQGLSFLGVPEGGYTLEDAQCAIDGKLKYGYPLYFDYVAGHVIKCDITEDEFDERLYDRDCGEGAAQAAIDKLENNS